MSKSKLKLTIQDLKDLGIIKHRKKSKRKNNRIKKKVYDMGGIKSSSSHMVGYGSSNLTNNPTQQLNNENQLIQRDSNIKSLTDKGNSSQLRQIEDKYNDVQGAITHLWNVNNHYGSSKPKIEEVEDDDDDVDIFGDDRNDFRFDNKDVTKSLSSDNFITDGDSTPSMINDINQSNYTTPSKSPAPTNNILGSVTITKPKSGGSPYTPYFDHENAYDHLVPDFIDDVDEVIPKVQTVVKQKEEPPPKIEKKGNINLSIPKVDLQQMYASFGGQDLKMLSGQATVKALREAIRKQPDYKAQLKYSK